MAITVDERILSLHTEHTTYQMKISEYGQLLHTYYGKRTEDDMSYLICYADRGFSGNPYDVGGDRTFSMDVLPLEYPCYGNGDFRSTAFQMKTAEGVYGCDLRYRSHIIEKGKYALPGLPHVYTDETDGETLKIVLADENAGVEVTLYYGVLAKNDVITRAVSVKNTGEERIVLAKAYSGSLDFLSGTFEMLHFPGRYGMERNMERVPLIRGTQSFGSRRGTSSHQHNPFVILAEQGTTEEAGGCYGMSFLYSGSFCCEAEKDSMEQTRVLMGIQSEMFEYDLAEGEVFYAPEIAYCYSENGLTELSERYHRLIREHVCRGVWKHQMRPILINNWEATYFDFTGEKIVKIAEQAAELGVDMLVLDDGWFGKRDSDNSGLGDWSVNEKKMGGPLSEIVKQVNELGMKFGLWIEPEMISEDSDLYRAHPDWAFTIPGRKPVRSRNQLVLDFSRKDIVDHIFKQISGVLDSADIAYLKMDMNRSIADVYSYTADRQNQGKILYRYVLGVYDFLERLTARYPELLIEGCSGGGGRFDAGMLYYTPQIWCSDNTDAIERLKIQYGTSFGYPISAVGAHVSAVPNHQTGRITDMHTRGVVAMAGTFGYELDLNLITEEEKDEVKRQINDCKRYWKLTHEGRYYRLNNPMDHPEYVAWEFVSEDKSEALLSVVTVDAHCNSPFSYVKLKGLREDAVYCMEGEEKEYSGSALMYGGLPLPWGKGEYKAFQVHLIQKMK